MAQDALVKAGGAGNSNPFAGAFSISEWLTDAVTQSAQDNHSMWDTVASCIDTDAVEPYGRTDAAEMIKIVEGKGLGEISNRLLELYDICMHDPDEPDIKVESLSTLASFFADHGATLPAPRISVSPDGLCGSFATTSSRYMSDTVGRKARPWRSHTPLCIVGGAGHSWHARTAPCRTDCSGSGCRAVCRQNVQRGARSRVVANGGSLSRAQLGARLPASVKVRGRDLLEAMEQTAGCGAAETQRRPAAGLAHAGAAYACRRARTAVAGHGRAVRDRQPAVPPVGQRLGDGVRVARIDHAPGHPLHDAGALHDLTNSSSAPLSALR